MTRDVGAPTPTPAPPRQTLAEALDEAFQRKGPGTFADRAVGLVRAILNVETVVVLMPGESDAWTVLAPTPKPAMMPDWLRLAEGLTSIEAQGPVLAAAPYMGARICLDTGKEAVLVTELPKGGQTALAMAHERLTLLSRMSYATFAPEEMTALQRILGDVARIDTDGKDAMQAVADGLAALTEAAFAAVGRFDGTRIADLAISGQTEPSTRGALPSSLKTDMAETARLRLLTQTAAYGAPANQEAGLVFHLDDPQRNQGLLPLVASAAGQMPNAGTLARAARRKAWRRRGIFAAALVAVGFIPLPDGVDLAATVAAENQRLVTSPLDAPVAAIEVSANDLVVAGETVLARLETRDIDLELIATEARYANALLDRETARAARRAADLRTAELEVARIEAEIALLESRKDSATLVSPISGVVIGTGLGDLEGALVRRGDRLMEIADPTSLVLDVSVPQSQVGRVTSGQTGIFRPDADPSLRLPSTLDRLSPAAPSGERSPVFPAEASLGGDTSALRPGMTGVLALDRSYRPIWQLLWRAGRDWVLLRLWI